MKILNLHGFLGEADNKNYRALCELFPEEDIISPKLNYTETAPDKLLSMLEGMTDADEFIFVGQSLGGWYADKLSRKYARPCILTNPCNYPHELPIIRDSGIPEKFIELYRSMSSTSRNDLGYVICSTEDTLLPDNHSVCLKLYGRVISARGSHSTIDALKEKISVLLRSFCSVPD